MTGATTVEDFLADQADARTMAIVASILPAEEAAPVWEAAIGSMFDSEIMDFVTLMPDRIARDAATSIARRSADDYVGRDAAVTRAIFARIGEESRQRQFDLLIDFLAEAASHGRPVLLRQFTELAPLLTDLGGDVVLNELLSAMDRTANWWP
jgi:hypothetical protein